MIKFNCLIHKETGTVVKYEEWLEQFKENGFITTSKSNRKFLYDMKSYMPDEAIFSDDFEIIYDSEFTLEELLYLDKICDTSKEELKEQLNNTIYFEALKVAKVKEDNHTIIIPKKIQD